MTRHSTLLTHDSFPRGHHSGRRVIGFTLLEVMIALGLTTLIIGVIGTAIRMYFINLKQAQSNMELTELARNTLNLMTSDIRSAIQYKPVDVSGLQELLDSQAAAIAGPTSASDTDSEADGDNADNATEDASSNVPAEKPQSTLPPENRPKFIGTNKEIAVDVSRLPRLDQYHPILHLNSSGAYTSLPTDVKSVSYFVSLDANDSSSVPGGLYRREVDRATMRDGGGANIFSVDAAAKQVAPEIVDTSFRYFDGEAWQEQWDSDESGGFPSAVEITIIIDPGRANLAQSGSYRLSDADPKSLRSFRAVTKLPLAEILSAEEQELIANPTEFTSPTEQAPTSGGDR